MPLSPFKCYNDTSPVPHFNNFLPYLILTRSGVDFMGLLQMAQHSLTEGGTLKGNRNLTYTRPLSCNRPYI